MSTTSIVFTVMVVVAIAVFFLVWFLTNSHKKQAEKLKDTYHGRENKDYSDFDSNRRIASNKKQKTTPSPTETTHTANQTGLDDTFLLNMALYGLSADTTDAKHKNHEENKPAHHDIKSETNPTNHDPHYTRDHSDNDSSSRYESSSSHNNHSDSGYSYSSHSNYSDTSSSYSDSSSSSSSDY